MNLCTPLILFFTVFWMALPALAKKSNGPLGLEQIKESQSLSQLIRSNTKNYWSWMKQEVPNNPDIQQWLGYEGTILGDPHLGNFGVSLVVSKLGATQELRFVPIDFDDVGVGPFVLDLARYVVATEAITSDIKKQDIVDAYVEGLSHPFQVLTNPTKEVKQALRLNIADYFRQLDKKIEKSLKKNGIEFEWKTGELESYSGAISKGDIEDKISGVEVLSLAHKVIDRGGSKDAERIWVLAQFQQSGRKTIFELKQWQVPGLIEYQTQPNFSQVLRDAYTYFWPDLESSTYSLISIDGNPYWLREKKLSLLDIPYTANTKSEVQFIKDQAVFTARALGQMHGRQVQGQQLLVKINSHRQGARELKEAIEPFIREYLDAVKHDWATQ
jgi:hypothetical protein